MFYSITFFILILLSCFHLRHSSFCWWSRCCLEPTSFIDGLEANMSSSLFGQHLVMEPLLTALTSHINFKPKKALVISFHGPAGVGKTFVAKMIAHHLFNGESYHIKFYSGRNDFVESKNIASHKEMLSNDVKKTVEGCGHSIFIFDEADKMSDGLFDVLKPFMDYYDNYQGVDYRRAIFIFMSNIGASQISKVYYNRKGTREELSLRDFENNLSKWLYNNAGGFKDSSLVVNFLVDYYIPFLPLEEEHIKKCIAASFREFNIVPSSNQISFIYDQLPVKIQDNIQYISSNCKKIATEVGKYAATHLRNMNKLRSRDEM